MSSYSSSDSCLSGASDTDIDADEQQCFTPEMMDSARPSARTRARTRSGSGSGRLSRWSPSSQDGAYGDRNSNSNSGRRSARSSAHSHSHFDQQEETSQHESIDQHTDDDTTNMMTPQPKSGSTRRSASTPTPDDNVDMAPPDSQEPHANDKENLAALINAPSDVIPRDWQYSSPSKQPVVGVDSDIADWVDPLRVHALVTDRYQTALESQANEFNRKFGDILAHEHEKYDLERQAMQSRTIDTIRKSVEEKDQRIAQWAQQLHARLQSQKDEEIAQLRKDFDTKVHGMEVDHSHLRSTYQSRCDSLEMKLQQSILEQDQLRMQSSVDQDEKDKFAARIIEQAKRDAEAASEEKRQLEESIATLTNSKAQLATQIEEEQASMRRLESELDSTRATMIESTAALQRMLADSVAQVGVLEDRLSVDGEAARTQLQAAEKRIEQLQADAEQAAAAMQTQLQDAHDRIRGLEEELCEQRGLCSDRDAQIQSQLDELDQHRSEIGELTHEVDSLNQKLYLSSESLEVAAARSSKLDGELSELHSRLNEAMDKCEGLEVEMKDQQHAHKVEIKELKQAHAAELTEHQEQYTASLQLLNESRAVSATLTADLTDRASQLAAQTSRVTELEEQLATAATLARASEEQIAAEQERATHIEQQLQDASARAEAAEAASEEDNKRHQQTLADMTHSQGEKDQAAADLLHDTRQELLSLTATRDDLQLRLTSTESQLSELTASLTQEQDELVSSLRIDLSASRAAESSLKLAADEMQSQIEMHRAEIEQQRQDMEKMTAERDEAQGDLERAAASSDELLAAACADRDRAAALVASEIESSRAAREQVETANKQISIMADSNRDLGCQIDAARIRVTELETAAAAQEETSQQLATELADRENEISTVREEMDQLHRQVDSNATGDSDLTARLSSVQSSLSAQIDLTRQSQAACDDANGRIESLESALAAQAEETRMAQAAWEEMQAELEAIKAERSNGGDGDGDSSAENAVLLIDANHKLKQFEDDRAAAASLLAESREEAANLTRQLILLEERYQFEFDTGASSKKELAESNQHLDQCLSQIEEMQQQMTDATHKIHLLEQALETVGLASTEHAQAGMAAHDAATMRAILADKDQVIARSASQIERLKLRQLEVESALSNQISATEQLELQLTNMLAAVQAHESESQELNALRGEVAQLKEQLHQLHAHSSTAPGARELELSEQLGDLTNRLSLADSKAATAEREQRGLTTIIQQQEQLIEQLQSSLTAKQSREFATNTTPLSALKSKSTRNSPGVATPSRLSLGGDATRTPAAGSARVSLHSVSKRATLVPPSSTKNMAASVAGPSQLLNTRLFMSPPRMSAHFAVQHQAGFFDAEVQPDSDQELEESQEPVELDEAREVEMVLDSRINSAGQKEYLVKYFDSHTAAEFIWTHAACMIDDDDRAELVRSFESRVCGLCKHHSGPSISAPSHSTGLIVSRHLASCLNRPTPHTFFPKSFGLKNNPIWIHRSCAALACGASLDEDKEGFASWTVKGVAATVKEAASVPCASCTCTGAYITCADCNEPFHPACSISTTCTATGSAHLFNGQPCFVAIEEAIAQQARNHSRRQSRTKKRKSHTARTSPSKRQSHLVEATPSRNRRVSIRHAESTPSAAARSALPTSISKLTKAHELLGLTSPLPANNTNTTTALTRGTPAESTMRVSATPRTSHKSIATLGSVEEAMKEYAAEHVSRGTASRPSKSLSSKAASYSQSRQLDFDDSDDDGEVSLSRRPSRSVSGVGSLIHSMAEIDGPTAVAHSFPANSISLHSSRQRDVDPALAHFTKVAKPGTWLDGQMKQNVAATSAITQARGEKKSWQAGFAAVFK